MSGKNKDITYGNINLPDDEFDAHNVKIRVTTFIDLDIVEELKKRAKHSKSKYQTMLNYLLRNAVFGESSKSMTEVRVRQIVKEILKEENKK